MSFDDATLMAFADGELPKARAAEVAAAVARDPALAAKVARFRAVREKLAGTLDGLASPPELLARAQNAEIVRTAARPLVWRAALAASVAGLVVGVAAVTALRPAGDLGPELGAQGALLAALDQTPSGETSGAVRPLYTVVAADGRACRAFRQGDGARAYEGVACRDGGGWRVLALAEAPPRPVGFGQASGDEPTAVTAALDALKAGDPLSAAAERRRIAARWRE
jgi:hypothetical protein